MGRLVLLLVALAIVAGVLLRPLGGVPTGGWPARLPALVERRGTTTLLILGLDRRDAEPARTDVMALMRIGPSGRATSLLSIPRDLWVSIPGRGREGDRINTAYFWGDLAGGEGVALARQTVEQAFELRVDRIVVLDFNCFRQVVNAAGGLTVTIPQRLVDEAYPDEATVVFEAGSQTLFGSQALQYARIRTPDSDFGRMRRQQQLAVAFGKRMEEPSTWLAMGATLLRRCPGSGTDLSPADVASLAGVSAMGGAPRLRLVDESMVTPTTMASGAQVLLPRWERIHPLVEEFSRP